MNTRTSIDKLFDGVKPYSESELNSDSSSPLMSVATRINERWKKATKEQNEILESFKRRKNLALYGIHVRIKNP